MRSVGRPLPKRGKAVTPPRIFADEPEARDAGVTHAYLEAAMGG
jgi:hypothetical protein